nr:transcriptional regulator, SARP family [Kibdelosporangium sp. MJ126-NF4]
MARTAFDSVDVPWTDCYHEDRGDAVFILAPAATSKAVFVEAIPPALVTALRIHNDTHPDPQRIRLRMALHAGEVHYDDHGVTSSSLTLTFRLIEAQPLKAALAASPGVLAVITSNWFFDDVVRHTPGAAPATYRPVQVAEKETSTAGWIALPDHPYPPDTKHTTQLDLGHVGARSLPVPRQLPLAVRDFIGRADHLATLDALLPTDGEIHPPENDEASTVVITAINGTAGIGKTTLAVHWAHRAQHRFPDGTLHANLRGYGPGDPVTSGEVLDGFIRALDTPAEKMPTGEDAQAALYRSLLAGRRMLIVLDNANSAEQIRPLLPGTAGCMVLVTSRDSLTGLVVTATAHRLTLDLLTSSEALELVTGIMGPDRVAAEPDAVTDLIRHCARLPLALRIAAGKVAAHPDITVTDVVSDLSDEHDRLNVLSHGNDERAAVRAVFDWSYVRLPAQQARLFRRLGLHPGPDLSLPAAAAVAELDPQTARRLLEGLAGAHLIEPVGQGRYRFHDLLRAYAANQARHHDHADEREHALRALLSWYALSARACNRTLLPGAEFLPLRLNAPEHPTHDFDRARAQQSLVDEQDNLLAAMREASRHNMPEHALHLAESLAFLTALGRWDEALEAYNCGLQTARRSGDDAAEWYFLSSRGETYALTRRWDEAQADYEQVLVLARTHGDQIQEGRALRLLGSLCCRRKHFQDGLSYLVESSRLLRDNARLEAGNEGLLSSAYFGLGRYRQAVERAERSRMLWRRCNDPGGEAGALHGLALAWQGLGEHQRAIHLCKESIALLRALIFSHRGGVIAGPLDTLAKSLHHTGDIDEAVACWSEASALLDDSGYPDEAAQVRQRLDALFANGEVDGNQN